MLLAHNQAVLNKESGYFLFRKRFIANGIAFSENSLYLFCPPLIFTIKT